jgi:tartrate dehydrogenase/decarboxylase/D-malate dehydrogenase
MREYRIALIPGDGIGKEVIAAGLEALEHLQQVCGDFRLHCESLPWGSDYFRENGRMMPEDGLERLRGFDAIYFGAVGDREIPDDVTLWGLRLRICQGFDQYANVRPARLLPGVESPLRSVAAGELDWVIVRENSEGEYAGHGGRAHCGLPEEIATETAVFTRAGVERIMRFAFERACSRPRKHLTVVTKSNAQRYGLVLWDEIAREIANAYPDVETERVLVDAAAARMVTKPQSFDVIVATNLHADILSDLAAALAGGLGYAPSANLNPERRFPSMFEPVHGAAFDIAGKGVANPVGAIWSAVLMLEHLGEPEAARRLMQAIERAAGRRFARTSEMTQAVCDFVWHFRIGLR